MTSLHCRLVALAIVVGLVGFVAVSSGVADDDSSAPWPAVVTVDTAAGGRAVPAGFLGLSLEYPSLETYAGRNARALDPLFARIIRSLSPGQSPVIRIGADSTDHTWWPVPKVRRPPGVSYTLTDNWMASAKALADSAGAKLIPGINLGAGSPSIARTEARTLINGIGARSIAALELGNEPELYRSFGWYRAPRRPARCQQLVRVGALGARCDVPARAARRGRCERTYVSDGDYAPFELTHDANGWHALAQPEYYGLLMFARATPRGSRLLPLSGGAAGRLAAWATRGRDGRVRVILINDDTERARMLAVRARVRPGAATLQRLEAKSVHSTTGVS
jgi:hypothetical protein